MEQLIFRITSFETLWQFWTGPFGHFVLPGLVLPAVVTLLICMIQPRQLWRHRKPILICMLLGVLTNSAYAYFWNGKGNFGMPTMWWFLIPLYVNQIRFAITAPPGPPHEQRMNAGTACAGSWLSLFPGDVVSGYVWQHFHPDPLLGQSLFLPLAILGGAGWNDGLLHTPITAACLVAIIVPVLTAIYRHPRYRAFSVNQKHYHLRSGLGVRFMGGLLSRRDFATDSRRSIQP